MASSSCFVLVLQFLLLASASALTSPKYIDAICKHVGTTDKAFCLETLKLYPPAASATGKIQAADAVLRLGMSYAKKSADFVKNAGTKNPNLKKQFKECQDAYMSIIANLKSASGELKESPETANYDVKVCSDETTIVKNLVGKNRDNALQSVIKLTLMMEKLIAIAEGATISASGSRGR